MIYLITAENPYDYAFLQRSIQFEPGEVSVSIPVDIKEDDLSEHTETWYVQLKNPINVDLVKDHVLIEVKDDDPLPVLSFHDRILSENSPVGERTIDIRLDHPSGRPVEVHISSVDAAAKGGEDFQRLAQTLVFDAGQTLMSVVLDIIDDPLYEPTEILILTLSGADFATIPDPSVLISILDNDIQPSLSYENAQLQEVDIDQRFEIPVRLDKPAGRPFKVEFVVDGVDDLRSDILFENLEIGFETGQEVSYLNGVVLADLRDEDEDVISLRAIETSDFSAPAEPLVLSILDNDPPPNIEIEASPLREQDSTLASVRLALSLPSEYPISAPCHQL